MRDPLYTLMLVTNREQISIPQYMKFIEQCATSGITSVQLREKNANPAIILDFAQQLKNVLDPLNIPLIINDDLELALQINASGVHLGQSDGSVLLARAQLGADKYIGLSIESEEQLLQANQYPVNYVAASAVFPTSHKSNIKKIWGLQGLNELARISTHPLIGIGGITIHNIKATILAGAKGAAIIGALHDAENPAIMASQLRALMM
jgi:thiamine-phosphate pyrophosphorylase